MLTKFAVKNFRNFEDWLIFDLSTPKQYEFNSNAVKDGIVSHAMIYGPNSGGKSNLGLAIIDPAHHLLDTPNLPSGLESNYLNAKSQVELAEFEFEFRFGKTVVSYKYGKENPTKLVYEQLTVSNRLVMEFDRRETSDATIDVAGAENLKRYMGSTNISIVRYLLNNAVLDDTPVNSAILGMVDFIKGMVFFRSVDTTSKGEFYGQGVSVQRLSQEIINRDSVKDFEQFLNEAGIECKLCLIPYGDDEVIGFDFGNRKLEFGQTASTGTKALGIFYYWWMRLSEGEIRFAYIDEFDAFYHHSLARLIVKKVSLVDCQTIMTTHNTGVMSNDLLRPDCYFELDKAIRPLSSLTNKDLRKAHNIEKIYKGMSS